MIPRISILCLSLAVISCDSTDLTDDLPEVEWVQIVDSDWEAEVAPSGDLIRMESGRLLRSSDHGDTWTTSEPAVPDGWLRFSGRMAVGSTGQIIKELYGLTPGEGSEAYRGLARSTDGGASFEEIPTEWLGPKNIFVVPNGVWIDNSNTIFVSAYNRNTGYGLNLFRLESGEETWDALILLPGLYPGGYLNFDPQGLLHLFAINDLTYRSRDGGRSWELLPNGPLTRYPNIILPDTRRIYRAGTHPEAEPGSETLALFTSEDEGFSWSHLDYFKRTESVTEVVVGTNGHLFAAVDDSKAKLIYRSSNEGMNWYEVTFGLPEAISGDDSIHLGGLMMGTDGYLYVHYFVSASGFHSVYRTTESVGSIK